MQLLVIGRLDGEIGTASRIAMDRGARITQARGLEDALETLRAGHGADLVMIDAQFDVGGFMRSLNQERISVEVVACGIGNDTDAAVRAIKAGAKEYIPLPPDPELIAAVLSAVSEETHAIIHRDEAMARVLKLAERVAPSDASILITGESGTGKELMARFLHRQSKRAANRFVAVNCAAIPENLLESELFGHEKGAFTGAVARRIGKFEEAHGGTLLLDEISEMDLRLQAKLLRVIQEKEIDRLGGSGPVKVDVRLIATSNRNLEEEVRKGTLREDLYYRLNVMTLDMPPLRERPDDIEPLAEHFVEKYSQANEVPVRPLADETRAILRRHPWYGNVRELENTMHRAVLLAQGDAIGPEAILFTGSMTPADEMSAEDRGGADGADTRDDATAADGEARDPATAGLVGRTVADVERTLILDTLDHCLGNRTHAANILGISIRTLRNKLKQYAAEGAAVPPAREAES